MVKFSAQSEHFSAFVVKGLTWTRKSHHLKIVITIFSHHKIPCQPAPLLPAAPSLFTWRTSPLAPGGEFPSTLDPGLLTTAPPLTSFLTPSHPTHRSSYNVYIDDINNTSCPCLAQSKLSFLKLFHLKNYWMIWSGPPAYHKSASMWKAYKAWSKSCHDVIIKNGTKVMPISTTGSKKIVNSSRCR